VVAMKLVTCWTMSVVTGNLTTANVPKNQMGHRPPNGEDNRIQILGMEQFKRI